MKIIYLSVLALLISGGMTSCSAKQSEMNPQSGKPSGENVPSGSPEGEVKPSTFQLVGTFRPSFYWIEVEKNNSEVKDQELKDVNGVVIAKVSSSYAKKLRMEGTGRLLDGRVLNFHSRVVLPDGTREIRWRVCDPQLAPFGYGVDEIPLDQFRSTAVDPSVIPIGSKVYIPAAKGAVLPDGTVHDGYFTAVDIGDLIQSKKIDIFTSFGDQSHVFESIGLSTGKMSEVYLVK